MPEEEEQEMTRQETAQLLKMRAMLVSQPYGDDAIDVWHEALVGYSFGDCRRAMIAACKESRKVTVAHIVEQLPREALGTWQPDRLCIRCQRVEAEPLHTRCAPCQQMVDAEVAAGLHSPALLAAKEAARSLQMQRDDEPGIV